MRFEPNVDSKNIRFQLLNQHRDKIGAAKTFDGVTLYLPHQFENNVRVLFSNFGQLCNITSFYRLHCFHALIQQLMKK